VSQTHVIDGEITIRLDTDGTGMWQVLVDGAHVSWHDTLAAAAVKVQWLAGEPE
jgi:hypothetical protein